MGYYDRIRPKNPVSVVNPGVLNAMQALEQGRTPEMERELFRQLLACTLLVAGSPKQGDGSDGQWQRTQGSLNVELNVVEDKNGQRVALAFTDADAVRRWRREGAQLIGLEGHTAYDLALRVGVDGLALNFGSPEVVFLSRHALAELHKGVAPEPAPPQIKPGDQLHIGAPPADMPEQVLAGAIEAGKGDALISRVYLFVLGINDGERRLTMAIDSDTDDHEAALKVTREFGERLAPSIQGTTLRLDLLVMIPAMLEQLDGNIPPLYAR